jgi:hypothetical protein
MFERFHPFRHHHHPRHHFPVSFIILQEGVIDMSTTPPTPVLTPILPGSTPVFTAVGNPAGSSLGAVIPLWSSSDPANVSITTDATGLVASVAIGAKTPPENVTLTIEATDPSTGKASTGTITFTVGTPTPPPPPPDNFPTDFTITRTS